MPQHDGSAASYVPATFDFARLRAAVQECRGCTLWQRATQAVFGEGDRHARVMLVGEQPGDHEDLEGHPFVGPAGHLLDRALDDAGVSRTSVYITNAVKHFKWQPRGKRRIHQRPTAAEVSACRPWLDAELASIHPRVVVCMGATAAQALLGSAFRVTVDHGKPRALSDGVQALGTIHPSAVLRAPDEEARQSAFQQLVDDLSIAAGLIDV